MDPGGDLIKVLIPLYALPLLLKNWIRTSALLSTITAVVASPARQALSALGATCQRDCGCCSPGQMPFRSLAVSVLGLAWAPPGLLAVLSTHCRLAAPTGRPASSFPRGMKGECACTCTCARVHGYVCVWWPSANFDPTWLGLRLTVMIPLRHSSVSGRVGNIFPAVINSATTSTVHFHAPSLHKEECLLRSLSAGTWAIPSPPPTREWFTYLLCSL